MMKQITKIIKKINLYMGIASGAGILVMGLILAYEVVCRYVFNSPTIWTQEISIQLFIWTMLAASSYTLQVGKHVRVDLLLERISEKKRLFLEGITAVVGAFYCLIVSFQAWQMLSMSIAYGKLSATLLRIPLWIPQTALLIGFSLLTLQFLLIFLGRIVKFFSPDNRGEAK